MIRKSREDIWIETEERLYEEAKDDDMTDAEAEVYVARHINAEVEEYYNGYGDYLYDQYKDRMMEAEEILGE